MFAEQSKIENIIVESAIIENIHNGNEHTFIVNTLDSWSLIAESAKKSNWWIKAFKWGDRPRFKRFRVCPLFLTNYLYNYKLWRYHTSWSLGKINSWDSDSSWHNIYVTIYICVDKKIWML